LHDYIILILGSFLGAALSILGGFINTKHSTWESKRLQEDLKLKEIENATKRLITKLKASKKLIEPLISAKDQILSSNEGIPTEIRGVLPIIEHSIEPIDWIQDLSIISNELDNDSFETLLNYFTNLKRCDDVINRVWELRAADINFQVQLHSYWILLESCKDSEKELDILEELLLSIKKKREKLYSQF
jgi:hypothetical protein